MFARPSSTLATSRAGLFTGSFMAVTTGTLGLFAGSLFLVSSAYSLMDLNRSATITITPQAWGWISDIRFDVEKSKLPTDAEVRVGPSLPEGYVPAPVTHLTQTDVLALTTAAPVHTAPLKATPTHRASVSHRIQKALARVARRSDTPTPNSPKPPQFSKPPVRAAAVLVAEHEALKKTSIMPDAKVLPLPDTAPLQAVAPTPVPGSGKRAPITALALAAPVPAVATPMQAPAAPVTVTASQAEIDTMQQLRFGLRENFRLALGGVPPLTTQAQLALASVPKPPVETSQWHSIQRKHTRKAATASAPKSVSAMIQQDLANPPAAILVTDPDSAPPPKPRRLLKEKDIAAATTDSLTTSHAAPQANKGPRVTDEALSAAVEMASQPLTTQNEVSSQPADEVPADVTQTTDEISENELVNPAEIAAQEEAAAEEKEEPVQVATAPAYYPSTPRPLPMGAAAAKLWAEYSNKTTQPAPSSAVIKVSVAGNSRVLNTQSPAQSVTTQVAPLIVTTAPTAPMPTTPMLIKQPVETQPLSQTFSVQKAVPLVEAFEWTTAISSGGYTPYTVEAKSPNGARGWGYAQSADHWSTLSRNTGTSVPLISNNTAKLLSVLSGASLQGETAIVFGKLPAGWSVRISGRAERPVILNANNQTLSPQSLEGERYFAFLNVAPGAHLLYLADRSGVEQGAIAVAALGGASTYTDLTKLTRSNLRGRVLDGSGEINGGLAQVTVRVLGNSASVTQSDSSGHFSVNNVLVVDGYPVFLETDSADGHTHRYQARGDQLGKLVLYRMNARAIQVWLDQLEGSVSPDSGIVLGALPGEIAAAGAATQLYPGVRSLAAAENLRPEVYTLDPTGQLEVDAPMSAQLNRFISVQVPEGPALVSLRDSGKHVFWSDLIVASPGVINIIGPQ